MKACDAGFYEMRYRYDRKIYLRKGVSKIWDVQLMIVRWQW